MYVSFVVIYYFCIIISYVYNIVAKARTFMYLFLRVFFSSLPEIIIFWGEKTGKTLIKSSKCVLKSAKFLKTIS